MIWHIILGALAGLSLALTLWQWVAARRFPLHRRTADLSFAPSMTLLKPLKGCDEHTETCLRSWFAQDYAGQVEIIFGVARADDPVCAIVQKLIKEFPQRDARLTVHEHLAGTNAKVAKLARMESEAKHELICVSDADVRVPVDFLINVVAPLKDAKTGLVNCFYRLANPSTLAMQWEAVAINADFWSQVLQSESMKPLDFALGAVMVTRRKHLGEIGGFTALENCLADDYQLGHRIAKKGHGIELSPVVVECWSHPMSWGDVWKHQLRWARTIRVCQPVPYFFSILSNTTLWAVLLICAPAAIIVHSQVTSGGFTADIQLPWTVYAGVLVLLIRIVALVDLRRLLEQRPLEAIGYFWLVPIKDLLQAALWFGAFAGNTVEWRGQRYRVLRDGTLTR